MAPHDDHEASLALDLSIRLDLGDDRTAAVLGVSPERVVEGRNRATDAIAHRLGALPPSLAVGRDWVQAHAATDWPRTSRLLPWSLALFLAMLWLVPFDGIELGVSLPLDAKLDRPILALMGGLWLLAVLSVSGPARPRLRWSAIHATAALFVFTALASVLLNANTLIVLEEFDLGVKKLALLLSYVLLFVIVASSVRRTEVRAFTTLIVGLACLTALGTVWEYRGDFNAFYEWTNVLFPGGAQLPVAAFEADSTGRSVVFGPTAHPLALAALLSMALPFALVRLLDAKELRGRLIWGAASALVLAGAFSTQRKTVALGIAAALIVLVLYRRRDMLRFAPFFAALLILVSMIAPSALGSVRDQLKPGYASSINSTQDRASDYDAVAPDVMNNLVIGRGYQTYEPEKYRVLDNEYLSILLGNGVLGLLAYAALFAAILFTCHRAIRSKDPARGSPALAIASATVLALVAGALFDVLAFPQVPYMLFFIAGLALACGRGNERTHLDPA